MRLRWYILFTFIGAGVLGIGTKMFRMYFLDWPNFMDAIVLLIGAITLITIGFKEVIKWACQKN